MRNIFTLILSTLFLLQANAQNNLNAAFVENKGQVVDQNGNVNVKVLYLLSIRGMNVQVHKNGFSYDTYVAEPSTNTTENKFHKILSKGGMVKERMQKQFRFHRVEINFEGANANPEIILADACSDYFNYYNNSQNELIQARRFNKIVYKNLYRGIDMEMVALNKKEQKFEYNFIVHPGADINQIKIRYNGATATTLSKNNSIFLQTTTGKFEEKIPLSFEQATKKTVQVEYVKTGANTYGFKADDYNRKKILVIDPSPDRVFSSYYGGANQESIYTPSNTVGTDACENFYMCGNTYSLSSIATAGAHQTTFGGNEDVFIVKFNSSGVRQWATYFGGSELDQSAGLSVDASGNIYVCGSTESTSSIATVGTHQTTLGGIADAFIVKFNSSGVRQWATYYGGEYVELFFSVSFLGTDVYVAGLTGSTAGISTAGSHQLNFGGELYDGMLVKFNSNGLRMWGTYFGGIGVDWITNLHIDASENLFITGVTTSSNAIATVGSHQTSLPSANFGSGFVAKFNSSGIRQWGSYYGGNWGAELVSIKTDGSGNIYILGTTSSTTSVATSGMQQSTYGGGPADGLLVKMNSSGIRQWATYIGGSGHDGSLGLSVDATGNIYVCGFTESTSSIATAGSYQTTLGGQFDAIILKYNTSGIRLWGSYYGGSDNDDFSGIAITSGGSIYAAGNTLSTSGIASAGSHQTTIGGSYDLFFVKFTDDITGVSQRSLEKSIKVYPNPVSKELIVNFWCNSNASFAALYTIDGKLVVQQRVNLITLAPLRINVAGFQSGPYLLKIWNNKDQLISAEKIIVKH